MICFWEKLSSPAWICRMTFALDNWSLIENIVFSFETRYKMFNCGRKKRVERLLDMWFKPKQHYSTDKVVCFCEIVFRGSITLTLHDGILIDTYLLNTTYHMQSERCVCDTNFNKIMTPKSLLALFTNDFRKLSRFCCGRHNLCTLTW